jgi:hypothetical protein
MARIKAAVMGTLIVIAAAGCATISMIIWLTIVAISWAAER